MNRAILTATAVLALGAAGTASATVLYSDLDVGGSYNAYSEVVIGQGFSSDPVAMAFTASASGSISEIDLALESFFSSGVTTVSLLTDVGNAPASTLGSWTTSSLPGFSQSSNTPFVISGISGIALTSGQSYFLQVSTPQGANDVWHYNTIGATGPIVQNGGAAFSGTLFAVAIQGAAAVPEPTSWALMLTGFAGLGAVLRNRRRLAVAI